MISIKKIIMESCHVKPTLHQLILNYVHCVSVGKITALQCIWKPYWVAMQHFAVHRTPHSNTRYKKKSIPSADRFENGVDATLCSSMELHDPLWGAHQLETTGILRPANHTPVAQSEVSIQLASFALCWVPRPLGSCQSQATLPPPAP